MAHLADFGRETQLSNGIAWMSYANDEWLAPALALDLDTKSDGTPAFHLSLTHGALPFQPPDPFARMDLTALCSVQLSDVVNELRHDYPEAVATTLWPERSRVFLGDMLLSPQDGDNLDVGGSRKTRMIRDLGWDGGQAAAAMIRAGANPLQFSGVAAFNGISPRVSATVHITPSTISTLAAALPNQASSREDLFEVFLNQLDSFAILGTVGLNGTQRFATCATLADRIFLHCGEPVGHDVAGHSLVRLNQDFGAPLIWNLLEPFATLRWLNIVTTEQTVLDVFLATGRGPELLSESTLASFPKSHHSLMVYSTFAADTAGLFALGITAQAAANPPDRPAAATATSVIDPNSGSASLKLKLARGEPLDYTLETFCVGQSGNRMWQSFGPLQNRNDRLIALGPADFGMQLFEITIAPDLLSVAELLLTITYDDNGVPITQNIPLTAVSQFVMSQMSVTNRQASVTLNEISGGASLTLNIGVTASTHISMHSFKGYGRQIAQIVRTAKDAQTVGLEVKPIAGTGEDLQTLAFNDRTQTRDYVYASQSPFHPGYLYRYMGAADWQTHLDPTVPLNL